MLRMDGVSQAKRSECSRVFWKGSDELLKKYRAIINRLRPRGSTIQIVSGEVGRTFLHPFAG